MTKAKEILTPQAILSDVDCTLLNSDKQLSIENSQAIKAYLIECQKNPLLPKLALCTARHPAALVNTVLPMFAEFAPDSLQVVCDGAMLINSKAEVFWQKTINPLITKKICQTVETLGGSFAFGHGQAFYCGRAFIKERSKTNEAIEFLHHSAIKDQQGWTTTLIVINHLNEHLENYIQRLDQTLAVQLQKIISTFDHQPYYNLTLPDISKAKGLKMWAEHYRFDTKDIMMIGDAENDIEAMMEGIGVAVANAQPAVKEVAELVLKHSNDEGAIAWLLQEILKQLTVN